MKVSYAITASVETEQLKSLIPFLIENKEIEDEIVVLFDVKNGDDTLLKYLMSFNLLPNVQTWRGFDFDNDFAKWKNKLNSYCTGDFILQLDGDETITKFFIKNLKNIIESNPTVDLFLIPRINVVDGITQDDIKKWNWSKDDRGYINWPDYQTRLYRKNLTWSGKVHERIIDGGIVTMFPQEEKFAIFHHKKIEHQRKQNEFYNTLNHNTQKSLQEIYQKYSDDTNSGSGDKGTQHSYIDVYEEILKKYRDGSNVLEIGIYHGMSMRMWKEYFTNSKIYGVDICQNFYVHNQLQNLMESAQKLISEGYNVFIDDATSPKFLEKIKDLKFDVIVDDGSHVLFDQIKSFILLKDKMKTGGLYIIEDVFDIDNVRPYFEKLHSNCEIIDRRNVKGRYDDVIILYKF